MKDNKGKKKLSIKERQDRKKEKQNRKQNEQDSSTSNVE